VLLAAAGFKKYSGVVMLFKSRIMIGLAVAFIARTAFADIQHIIVFRYKADVTAETKAGYATRFFALKDLAKRDGHRYIVSITGGQAISKEGFDQGLEQAFVVTFKNEADRNYFVGAPYSDTMDPAHEALVQFLVPKIAVDDAGKLTGIFVFDFSDGHMAR
jgi:hypothetical protein